MLAWPNQSQVEMICVYAMELGTLQQILKWTTPLIKKELSTGQLLRQFTICTRATEIDRAPVFINDRRIDHPGEQFYEQAVHTMLSCDSNQLINLTSSWAS